MRSLLTRADKTWRRLDVQRNEDVLLFLEDAKDASFVEAVVHRVQ